jgi:hypothetical protein
LTPEEKLAKAKEL